MAEIQITDELRQNLRDLERESLVSRGVSDLVRMFHSITDTHETLESFDEGIWLIGEVASDNSNRISNLTESIFDAVIKQLDE